jgi:hypothetical protein
MPLRKSVCKQGDRKVSSPGVATENLDRRMSSLIEAYQDVFAGTTIATLGFAMATAGLERPKLLGMDVVEQPARGMVPIPGRAACGLQPRYLELSKERPRRRF